MKRILYLILLINSFAGHAQTVLNPSQDNLVWEYSQMMIDETSFSLSGKFITHTDKSVEWIQNDSNDNPYSTSGVSGTWTDSSIDGSITFNVKMDESTGTIEFKKAKGQTKVTINMTNPGRKSSYFRFTIDNVKPL